ncbi:hypothetical protein Hokovirus_1_205 [Hokovirus HKV1]|uniref:Leucine-rich repeat protein n=1 Tax=Hokovirus HKV1 TaxID=1977638 RepID=A0A1V0SF31_9VIRU|nr:hypothetical protein Hokovirus_1_205 [Hokovirus HKV1]
MHFEVSGPQIKFLPNYNSRVDITSLSIINTSIEYLDFSCLPPNIIKLDASFNQIKECLVANPEKIPLNLAKLDLSNNNLTKFNILPFLPNLRFLYLDRNDLTRKLEDVIDFSNTRLTHLSVSNNKINKISSLPNSLKRLFASKNLINTINIEVENLNNIDIENNLLETVCISGPNLKEIWLKNNHTIKEIQINTILENNVDVFVEPEFTKNIKYGYERKQIIPDCIKNDNYTGISNYMLDKMNSKYSGNNINDEYYNSVGYLEEYQDNTAVDDHFTDDNFSSNNYNFYDVEDDPEFIWHDSNINRRRRNRRINNSPRPNSHPHNAHNYRVNHNNINRHWQPDTHNTYNYYNNLSPYYVERQINKDKFISATLTIITNNKKNELINDISRLLDPKFIILGEEIEV